MPDETLSLAEGALAPWAGARFKYFERLIDGIATLGGFSIDTPWKKLKAKDRKLILYGVDKKAVPVRYRNRYGRGAHLRDHLQRHRRLARAQAQRGRRRLVARAGRAVHARGRVHAPVTDSA